MKKRILAFTLAILTVLSLLPLGSLAEPIPMPDGPIEPESALLTIRPGHPYSFWTEMENGSPLCYLSPFEDGLYQIMTTSFDCPDLVPWVRDAEYNRVETSGSPYLFSLKADETYTIAVYSYQPCTVEIFAEKVPEYYVTDLSITNPPENTEYVEGYFNHDVFDGTGMTATVTFSDGFTGTWTWPGYEPVRDLVSVSCDLEPESGVVTVSCQGVQDQCTVSLIESPVERLELVENYAKPLIFETDGYSEPVYHPETGETNAFIYYIPDLSGYKLRVYYKDGTSKLASPAFSMDRYYFEASHEQREKPWKLGSDNEFTISYLGADVTVPVTVAENPVAGIEIVNDGPFKIVEHSYGYWETPYVDPMPPEIPEFPEPPTPSDPHDPSDPSLPPTTATPSNPPANPTPVPTATTPIPTTPDCPELPEIPETPDCPELPEIPEWPPIPETPLIPETPADSVTNSSLESSGEPYFYYYADRIFDEVQIKVKYKDGSEKTVSVYEPLDGRFFEWRDDQSENHWKVGTEGYVTVSYMGFEAVLQVEIVENSVVNVTLDQAPEAKYVFGSVEYGYLYDSTEYSLNPVDFTGMALTVEYEDGSKKTFTKADVTEENKLNGIELTSFVAEPVRGPGEYPAVLEYLGYSFSYTLTVLPSPVASIEWTRAPSQTVIYDGFFEPSPAGAQLTVTMTDGTQKTVTVTEDNLEHLVDGHTASLQYRVEDQGLTILIDTAFHAPEKRYSMIAKCFDQTAEFSDFTAESTRPCFFLQNESFSTLAGGKISGRDRDGTELFEVTLSEPCDEGTYDFITAYRSELGFLTVYGVKIGETEEMTHYLLNVCGQALFVSVERGETEKAAGDLNGDGAVSSADAIYLLYHTLLGSDRYPVTGNCDYNGDGAVSSADAIYLLYHTLLGGDRYPI